MFFNIRVHLCNLWALDNEGKVFYNLGRKESTAEQRIPDDGYSG